MEWIPKAQDRDRRVEQTMLDFGCQAADVEFVRDFPLPPLRTSAFTYPKNSQWSIPDVRRERLEGQLRIDPLFRPSLGQKRFDQARDVLSALGQDGENDQVARSQSLAEVQAADRSEPAVPSKRRPAGI